MNEFIAQFLLECRELVEQATADLLALEKDRDDRERLNSAFRAFHTLKGSAAIVDFNAMARAVHAAEDVLSGVRSGARVVSPQLISDCFACLDQVGLWLDSMEHAEDLPQDADREARVIVERFMHAAGVPEARTSPHPAPADSGGVDWAEPLLTRFEALRASARTAVRYTPSPDCFFEGVDPLARVAALPGLLCLDLTPAAPWPQLDELDPFSCNLVLTALTRASSKDVLAAMSDAADDCVVQALAVEDESGEASLSPNAREVLEAQIALLAEGPREGYRACVAAAGLVAANVLRHANLPAAADQMQRTTEAALAANEPDRLREAIAAVLRGPSDTESRQPSPAAPESSQGDPESRARTLRIEASRIDALVTLTGELTVAKNAIGHLAELSQGGEREIATLLRSRYAVLDRLVGELQRTVVRLRVLPLRHVFQRIPRFMRELSADVGKPVDLVIEGGDTEADKAVVEMLFEPLLHVLRNALDHGIEAQSIRLAQLKPSVASIRLRAERLGEHVVVEVLDDGAGIDVARVRQVALERKLLPEELIHAMSDEEATHLIFQPGFSTTALVTDLSGRGVGMDAARRAVEALGGQVTVKSRTGHGTSVRFTLPFSVMMTRVMVVGAGEQVFGMPLDTVVETVRVSVDRIAPIGAAQAVVLRNRTLPLVDLSAALGLAPSARKDTEATIVVTRTDGQYGALRVDRVGARMDVMLKPLEGLLAGMPGLAGSTLLGDGSVLLILAPGELFH